MPVPPKKTKRKNPYKRYRTQGRRKGMYRNVYRPRLTGSGVPSGMPIQRVANLRYCQTFQLTSTTSSIVSQVFRANSIYDPDYSGLGHQPMGRDQWAALYNHGVVIGSKINVQCISPSPETELFWTGCMLNASTTVPYGSATAFVEARKGSYKLCNPTQGKSNWLTSMFSAKKYFNIKDIKDNLDRLGFQVGNNPTEEAAFIVWMQALNSGTVTAEYVVTIDYIVLFSEPVAILQS